MLAKNPEIQKRAHEELDKVLPNLQDATFADFEKFHFVENIMKETQRVYPVAAFLIRTVTKEFEYKGTLIPAGVCTWFSISQYIVTCMSQYCWLSPKCRILG